MVIDFLYICAFSLGFLIISRYLKASLLMSSLIGSMVFGMVTALHGYVLNTNKWYIAVTMMIFYNTIQLILITTLSHDFKIFKKSQEE